MKVVCIDIETTGLDPNKHQIIEFAALIGDIATGEELGRYKALINHEQYSGDPIALAMNSEIFREIEAFRKDEEYKNTYKGYFYRPQDLWSNFSQFVSREFGRDRPTAAGKNFAGFDLLFLSKLPGFYNTFNHRVFDPGSIFYQPGDQKLPDLKTCLQRAGFEGSVKHRALDDCQDVFKLLCYVHRNPIHAATALGEGNQSSCPVA